MGDSLPSPPAKPHLALLASWALTHDQRRQFVVAYRQREAISRQMRQLADAIVSRAEALTIQDHPGLRGPAWSKSQTASFNRWLERLMRAEASLAQDLTRQHQAISDCVEDLARAGRFRSADRLASVLMLDREVAEGAANER